MQTLKIKRMGDKTQGVTLKGDPSDPEPIYFRVAAPGFDVDVVRSLEDSKLTYWVHVRVNRPGDGLRDPEDPCARVIGARVDANNRSVGDLPAGVLADPHLNHLAVRIEPGDGYVPTAGRFLCSTCGSLDVQEQVWLEVNTGAVASDGSGEVHYYCPHCDDDTIEIVEEGGA